MKTCNVCAQAEVKKIGEKSYKCPACKTKFVGEPETGLFTEAQLRAGAKKERKIERQRYDAECQIRGRRGGNRRYL